MNCEYLIPLSQIVARVVMMSLVSLGAIFSIYWGWRLYMEAVQSKVSGEVQYKGIIIKFVSAGPGIVLAGFGAWLLSTVAMHPAFKYKMEVQDQTDAVYSPMEPVTQGRFITVATNLKQTTDNIAKDAKRAAGVPKKAPACACRNFRKQVVSSSMGGISKTPSNEEILQSLEVALAAVRATLAPGTTIAPQTLKTLESLEYLKELAVDEVARDQADATNGKL